MSLDPQVVTFTIVAAALTVTPGADTLLVVRNTLRGAASGAQSQPADVVATADVSPARCFREGFLTNVLNPKVAVFYLAFLPQFIGPADPVLQKSLLLTAIHFAQGILWLGTVAFIVDRSRRVFLKPVIRRWMDAVCGTLLVGLGLRLAIQRQ